MCRLQPENVFLISIVFFKLVDPREGERERVCVTERETQRERVTDSIMPGVQQPVTRITSAGSLTFGQRPLKE